VKISSPDGQEIVYTSLDTNQPKTQASTVKTSSVPRKRESDGGPLLLQELTKERPAAPAPAPVARSSSEDVISVVASLGYYDNNVWTEYYHADEEVFVKLYYDDKLFETIKMKLSLTENKYVTEFPFSPNSIVDKLSLVKDYILDFLKTSEDEYFYEMELLTNQLVELEFITPNQVPWDEWLKIQKKIQNLEGLLDEKETEYLNRFAETKQPEVKFLSYAREYGFTYNSVEGWRRPSKPNNNTFFDHIDVAGEMRITAAYLEPEYPKASIQESTYRVYVELFNIEKRIRTIFQ
jgi:hypothetical protein